MIQYNNGKVTITCDKCGHSQTAIEGNHNQAFWNHGWGLYPNAKKYQHKCYDCMPKSQREAHDNLVSKLTF